MSINIRDRRENQRGGKGTNNDLEHSLKAARAAVNDALLRQGGI